MKGDYEEWCRGHREYVDRIHAAYIPARFRDPDEPDPEPPDRSDAGPPADPTDCPACRSAANEYAYGVHGVGAMGCPNCGSDLSHETDINQYRGVNYTRCYECRPPFPILGKPVRILLRGLRRLLSRGEGDSR